MIEEPTGPLLFGMEDGFELRVAVGVKLVVAAHPGKGPLVVAVEGVAVVRGAHKLQQRQQTVLQDLKTSIPSDPTPLLKSAGSAQEAL